MHLSRKGKKMGSRGPRKIERIENELARDVCFTKRRRGLFNKAGELSALCGAEVALVVYSPAGNPYSFGSPGVDRVADRFLLGGGTPGHGHGIMNVNVEELAEQNALLSKRLEAEAAKKSMLEERLNTLVQENRVFQFVKKNNMEGLEWFELEWLKESLAFLTGRLKGRVDDHENGGSGASAMAVDPVISAVMNRFGPGADQVQLDGDGPAGAGEAHQDLGYGRGFY